MKADRQGNQSRIARHSQALAVLHEIDRSIGSELDFEALLVQIVQGATQALEAQGGTLYLHDVSGGELRVIVEAGAALPESALKQARELARRVFEGAQPDSDPGEQGLSPAALAVPLIWQGECIGVLALFDKRNGQSFDSEDTWLADLFAVHAAIVAGNASLLESVRRRAAVSEALSAIGAEFSSQVDAEHILHAVAREFLKHTQARHVHIYLHDGGEQPATLGASLWGSGEVGCDCPSAFPDTVEWASAHSGKALIITDSPQHPLFAAMDAESHGFPAVVALPFKYHDQDLGAISLAFTEQPSEATLQLLELLVNGVAIAVANIRVYEEHLKAQERFRDIVLNSADWLWEIDGTGGVTYCSERVLDVLGYHPDELIGRQVFELMAPGEKEILSATLAGEGRYASITGLELAFTHKDGHMTHLSVCSTPILGREDELVGYRGIARDITPEREAEQREQLAYQLGQQLITVLSLDELLKAIVERVKEILGYYHVLVCLYDPNGHVLVVREGTGMPGAQFKAEGIRVPLEAEPSLIARAARTLEPVVSSNVSVDPYYKANALLPDTRSEAALPLFRGERLLGVLDVQATELDRFQENELRTLQNLAAQLSVAVENASLYKAALQAEKRFRSIALSSSDWIWEVNRAGRITYCSERVSEVLGYSAEEMVGRRVSEFVVPEGLPTLMDTFNELVRQKKPIVNVAGLCLHKEGHRVYLSVSGNPVCDEQGRLIGYQGLAKNITQEKEAEQREQLAYRLGRQLTQVLSPDELLRAVVLQIKETLGFYHVHIFFYDEERQWLRVEEGTGEPGAQLKAQGFHIPLDARPSLVARAARTLQAVSSNDVTQDSDYLPNPLLPDTRSELALPLFRGKQLLGVLDVQAAKPGSFCEDEVRTLENLAAQVAIAIENARLYRAVKQQAAYLEDLVGERTTEIVHERERLRAIVDNAGEGISFTHHEGWIQYVNPAWERITGLGGEVVVGKKLEEFYKDVDTLETIHEMTRTAAGGEVWKGELHARRPDGSLFDAAVTLAPVIDKEGEVVNLVGVLHDITAPKELERVRRKFIANVSHELRTPISNLKLYHTLLQTGAQEKRETYLETMSEQIEQLEGLIKDLLDLSRLDRGALLISPVQIDLNELVREAVDGHLLRAEEYHLQIETDLASDLPLIFADPERFKQVLNNLLINAMSYTPPGGKVGVRTSLVTGEIVPLVALGVWDTGIGIAPKDLPFIFQRFFRAESVEVKQVPGTGLGLSIVKEIVELHDGQIRVESTPGRGSQFTILLPVGMKPPRKPPRKE